MESALVHIFLKVGDIGIIIGSRTEVQPGDKPITVKHDINAKQQGDTPHCNRNNSDSLFCHYNASLNLRSKLFQNRFLIKNRHREEPAAQQEPDGKPGKTYIEQLSYDI